MKSFIIVILAMCLFYIAGCGVTDPPPPPPTEVTKVIDETGGEISLGHVTVEIPADAISGEATFTLKGLDYNLEDSLDVRLSNEAMTIIIDGATVTDSIYVILPPFITDSELNVVGLKNNGIWQPLEIIEEDIAHIKVCIPIEIFELESSNRRLLNSALNITSMTVAGIEPFIKLPKSISLNQITYVKPSGPAIVLIHGIFSDNTRWKDDFINDYLKHVGDVYELEYPWTLHYMDIAQDVIGTLVQQLGGRNIYFVCHSKGGLVARAIIRLNETNNYGLSIDKALYFATPHFGAPLANIDLLFDHVYGPTARLINPNIKASEGIMELSPYSSELSEINQPLFFENSTPKYKCIIGDVLGSDLVVLVSSADLASPEHFGERENAVYYNTLHRSFLHWLITNYPEQIWPDIESFFGSENPSDGFVPIPQGTFTMGSPADEIDRNSDETLHTVTLTRSFTMLSTEVTNQQYAEMAQWAYNNGYCTATTTSLRDNLDGSTQELLDLD